MGSPELLLLILGAGGETGAEVIRGLSWGILRGRHHRVLRLGAAPVIGFILAGQVIPSVILGWLGLLNLPIRRITLPKLAAPPLASLLWSRAPDHNTLWLSNITLPFPASRD